MLKIENLQAKVDSKKILKGLNLNIKAGEIHAIMGPNGSGKSTLANVLAGNENYEVNSGKITFKDKDLLDLNIDGVINVVDIVQMVNTILSMNPNLTEDEFCLLDLNIDGVINVVDIVMLVNTILG